jgi:general secretion pathway protein F
MVRTRAAGSPGTASPLRTPIFGRLIRYVAISRFARTLATLTAGGVSIVPALEISKTVASNAVIGGAIDDVKEAITRGSSIAGTMRTSGQFPPLSRT